MTLVVVCAAGRVQAQSFNFTGLVTAAPLGAGAEAAIVAGCLAQPATARPKRSTAVTVMRWLITRLQVGVTS